MNGQGDAQDRDRWARLRFSVIGPLLAAPPERGELRAALVALSAKTWRHPVTGLPLALGRSTIERWYYAARAANQDPIAALKTRVRADCGQQRGLTAAIIAALAAQPRASELVGAAALRQSARGSRRRGAAAVLQHAAAAHEGAGLVQTGPGAPAPDAWNARRQRAPAAARSA